MKKVNHPQHYGGDVVHETWKCLKDWGLESDAMLWTAVKYIARAGKKIPTGYTVRKAKLEDLRKARWYLNNRIESLKEKKNEDN